VNRSQLLTRIVILVCCMTFAHARGNPKAANDYKKALKQMKSGDLKIDFKALRMDCAASGYSCEADAERKKKIDALLNGKKFDEALKETGKALEKAFVDMELHYFSYIANTELNNRDKAEFHKAVFDGLLNSIRERKRGRSKKDAFIIINAREEDVFLKFSRMRVLQKRLLNEDGHYYDEITSLDMDALEDTIIYFNMDIPLMGILNSFKEKQ
jgi:hypothetical protein